MGPVPRLVTLMKWVHWHPCLEKRGLKRFKEWGPYIKVQKLNIEEDPVAQNFDPHSYDVVVAVNVST